ncbi:MAG: ABC transporter substrate-binding protein [Lachnospiraceae bacterium]|nr:ABC transporter substrate-binding protein [Lachnospiraceae bacterium]
MKKKLLSILLAAAMTLSLVACGGQEATETPAETPAEEAPAEEAPAEESAEAPAESRPNRLIYGSTTEISGDLGNEWWTNNATDMQIRKLIDDYHVVRFDQDGAMIVNSAVVDGDIQTTENEDGSKTFTVKIKEDLKYNTGDPITAADFVAYALVMFSPATLEAGGGVVADYVVGSAEYQSGESYLISGLRLLDDYTYAITIVPEYLPYFFEQYYANLMPLYLPMYAPNATLVVKDDGEGVYLDGGELNAEDINASRFIYEGRVSAGPYQLVNIDTGTLQAELTINPNYAGNFEGQKPSIETLIIVKAESATAVDSLKTGAIDILDTLTDGNLEINPALDLVDAGGYSYVDFERNGYGKIQFACDFGPTQFPAVRQAVALLLDRNEFANQFCAGYGSVVDGPYGLCMWMYKDSQEFFADNMDSYSYDPAKAIELLEADGWVLNEDGTEYSGTGTRYKEVTAEEAGTYALNVTLADGRILMPLHIMWSSSEDNPVSELLVVMLANGQQTADAGMVIEQTVMSFTDLLNYMYRDASVDAKYGVPTYGMFNLATGFTQMYNMAYEMSMDEAYWGTYNNNFIADEKLAELAWDMVYGVEAGDEATYLDMWQQFMDRWNELLPDVPLYSNIYYTVHADWLEGYDQSSYWEFRDAVLYASIANAE